MMSAPELYKIWCKHVPAGEQVDRMTVDQFLAAAADVITATETNNTNGRTG